MTLSARRMDNLLNKSPESGYIHSRNGASGSQRLCTMKEGVFKKIHKRIQLKKGSDNTAPGEAGRAARPLSRGCSAPGTGWAATGLACLKEPEHRDGLQIPGLCHQNLASP